MNFIKQIISITFCTAIFSTCAFSNGTNENWLKAPALKDAYKGKIEHIGMSVQYIAWPSQKHELASPKILQGLEKHFTSITMGNEFKPDSILGTYTKGIPQSFEDFTDSFGTTIKVPKNHLQFDIVDKCLTACKEHNLKMRGHVLVWYSQTPDWFFKEDYNSSKKLVDKKTMTARQEWYIKSVLSHIAEWEKQNNNNERLIYCWDVVNEAADDSGTQLRAANNHWHMVYESDEYIINAFRFANKYAPKEVLLAYNDYNECMYNKRNMILKILKSIISHKDDDFLPTRIDVMGMQSHNKYASPLFSDYENAIKKYLATGLDIHITELDIGAKTKQDADDAEKLKQAYKDSYNLYLKYAKTNEKNGISSVTIWGLTDDETWLNSESQQPWLNFVKQYPLLFTKNHKTKPAFYGVLEAGNEYNK